MDKKQKKRGKSYYFQSSQAKRQKLNKLDSGMKGFLVTCNHDEKQAVREAYNLLNEYADTLYGQEANSNNGDADDPKDNSGNDSDDGDMEKAMNKEVQAMKDNQVKERRFQNCYTNTKNCIFIKTTIEDPCLLAHNMFEDLASTKKLKARFAMRLLPIAGTCKAHMDNIKKLGEDILSPYFSASSGFSYSIQFKSRNNGEISRDSVLMVFGQMIKDMNPMNSVNLDKPDVFILVEILCKVFCMSVVKDFFKFRRYNLHEVVKETVLTESPIVASEGSDSTLVKKSESDASTLDNPTESCKETVVKDISDLASVGDAIPVENNESDLPTIDSV